MIAVALTLDPVWNSHSVSPVSSSRATNSPVIRPVNSSPPPVASTPAELGKSRIGISHFFSPVSGSTATTCPSRSPGSTGGKRLVTPVELAPMTLSRGSGRSCWMRGTCHVVA